MITLPAHQYGLIFRLVEERDAEFILSLRTDPKLARHLSATENDLPKQQAWIRTYKQREALGQEYYFLFENEDHEPQGLVRLYDFDGKTYTSGSWLIKPGADEFAAIKADLFSASFAMNELGFERCVFDVRKANKKVLRFHLMFASVTGEDELNVYLALDRAAYERKFKYLTSIIKPQE
ncbi:acetyltransferase (GNAT) family protein [Mucilaginibacter oryzae]|uniref:Acetyltransferase (GNAT) family protein n=1 Tax=Mucilaginibacter oryzae TaxID=468058 RepID=A0A316HIM4_9SPHI|nr:GNAT family N-acetyltransferase [Mucilaginibacter oryzae]PWK79860.1 acetyltransferase (GNAT) family protein [Mucilaginibacter oryzae]